MDNSDIYKPTNRKVISPRLLKEPSGVTLFLGILAEEPLASTGMQ